MKNPKTFYKIIVAFLGALTSVPCNYASHAYKDIVDARLNTVQTPHGNLFEQTAYASLTGRAPVRTGEFTAFIPTITRKRKIARPMASGKKTYRGAIACPEYSRSGQGSRSRTSASLPVKTGWLRNTGTGTILTSSLLTMTTRWSSEGRNCITGCCEPSRPTSIKYADALTYRVVLRTRLIEHGH